MKYAADFRETARNSLKNRWGIAILAGFLASLLGGANIPGGSVSFTVGTDTSEIMPGGLTSEQAAIILGIVGVVLIVTLVVGIALFIVGSVVSVGYSKFNLMLIDGEEVSIGTLFSYFSQFGRILLAQLLRELYTFLWSLLFIIPGVIASYKYAMVPYILAENPDITPSEAIEQSKRMMEGNKWRLFCLQLSFFGWLLLNVFTCGIGSIVLLPYMEAARADFYREVSGTRKPPMFPPMGMGEPGFYNPNGQQGYYPPNNSGYYPPNNGGYYPPSNQGYYPPSNTGYYPPNQQGGFTPQEQGHYPPNDQQRYETPSDQGYQQPSNDDTPKEN